MPLKIVVAHAVVLVAQGIAEKQQREL